MGGLESQMQLRRVGEGPPILFLHGMDGLLYSDRFMNELARTSEVIAPLAPGWAKGSARSQARTVDALAYAYLDLLDEIGTPIPVIGSSLGAWLALEVATKSCVSIESLVLVSPIGIRRGPPEERNYLDLYASPREQVDAAMYGSADRAPNLTLHTLEQFEELALAQEGTASVAWDHYMHNPRLEERLHRVTVPTLLVRGRDDGFTLRADLATYMADLMPGARSGVTIIEEVGHRVEEQAPDQLAEIAINFIRPAVAQTATRGAF